MIGFSFYSLCVNIFNKLLWLFVHSIEGGEGKLQKVSNILWSASIFIILEALLYIYLCIHFINMLTVSVLISGYPHCLNITTTIPIETLTMKSTTTTVKSMHFNWSIVLFLVLLFLYTIKVKISFQNLIQIAKNTIRK